MDRHDSRLPGSAGGKLIAMHRVLARVAVIVAILSAVGCDRSADPRNGTIQVFAATSLTDLLEAAVDTFEASVDDAPEVQLHLAGSSLLARQIEYGAGADVFISAHPTWTDHLAQQGFLRTTVVLPITNRLVLISRRAGLRVTNVERLALADPDHVPAGIYARSVLECEQLWTRVEERVAATVDVRGALAAVEEGAADAAIVYSSDARFVPHLHVSEPFTESCRPEIVYTMGLAPSAARGAELFAAFMLDSLRAPMWEAFGFASRAAHADSVLL